MLRLEKLVLRGFKSFCEPTEIIFHEGITAVVGPNGCGKSNILDAIAWVLGEQSARSLRGGKMDDVIFNGTRERKPLGLAEVALTLVACEDISPRTPAIDDIEVDGELPGVPEPAPAAAETEPVVAVEALPVVPAETAETVEVNLAATANVVAEPRETSEETTARRGRRSKPNPKIAFQRAFAGQRQLPTIAAGERVVISRRLYRSGESEYLMNGHSCRLRDIQDFFAGTGLGGAQYAIIEQGHIGQILSAKPQERRGLIEEAAGITKFKAKKHLAELKLEATRQNLARLNDIISEVDRQLGALKRQAAKARRYHRLRERMRLYWRSFFTIEYRRIEERLREVEDELAAVRAREQALTGTLTAREAQYREAQQHVYEKETQLEQARTQATSLEIETDRTRSRIGYQRAQRQEIATRIADFHRELQVTAERAALVDKEIARRRQDLNKINQELSQDEIAVNQQETSYRAQLEQQAAAERELESSRTQLLAEVGKTERLRHLKQQLSDNLKKVMLQQQNLGNEAVRAEERHNQCQQDYQRIQTEISTHVQQVDILATRLREIMEQLEVESREAESEQSTLADLVRECARVEDRLASLVELDEQRAFFSESVQQLLADANARRDFHLLGTLADFLDVAPKYETMVERVLGEWLQAVIVPTLDDTLAAANWLNTHQAGGAAFLVTGLHGCGSIAVGDADTSPDAAGSEDYSSHHQTTSTLLELLGLKPEMAQLVRRVLPELANACVTVDLATALQLSAAMPTTLIVTLAGERVRASSLLVTGTATENGVSVLQLKREIKDLTSRLVTLGEQREQAVAILQTRRAGIAELETERIGLDTKLRNEEKQLVGKRVEVSQSERELERARQHMRVVAAERAQADTDFLQCEEKLTQVQDELTRAEQSRTRLEQSVEQVRARLAELKSQVEVAAQGLAQLRADMAARLERRRAAMSDLRRLEEEVAQLARRSERDQFELLQFEGRERELTESLAQAEADITELDAALARARALVLTAEHELTNTREGAIRLEAELETLRTEIAAAHETRTRTEVESARLQTEAQHLEQACRNELAESLATIVVTPTDEMLAEENEEDNLATTLEVDQIKETLEDLRAKIDELGPVNMMALEELAETEERYTFLQQQYKDVLESIAATEEALREIKRRSRTRFCEAFEQINANFSVVFQELFGGGRGEMALINEEDVLESGIDIIAQPPGKRLQSVLLLSGGEKAMTALALILAIFRFRPSPFCVLDEVDAPLDDINIGRFTEKIRQMSEQTQFLVITHSKRTMEAAASLYGITMEEAGVSKLISVRLQ
ncbi:MAG: chromosome segregation protein SMC [Acidobacteriota bacterium]